MKALTVIIIILIYLILAALAAFFNYALCRGHDKVDETTPPSEE